MPPSGFRTFAPLEILTADLVNDYLMTQAAAVFASTVARDAAILNPAAGQMCVITTPPVSVQVYDGAQWTPFGGLTEEIVGGAVAAVDWSVDGFIAHRAGQVVNFRLDFTRTGATIPAVTGGDISNVLVATLPASVRGAGGAGFTQGLTSGVIGRAMHGYYNPNSGEVFLASGIVADIDPADSLTLGGTVLLDT